MKLSIYMSEDNIRVLVGKAGRKIVIKSAEKYELPKGTIINDVILDENEMKKMLSSIHEHYKKYSNNVYLVLASSHIVSKVMEVPQLSKHNLLELTKNEIRNFTVEASDLVYDYSVIKKHNYDNKGGTILCAAIERETINKFITLFAECGFKLKSIDIPIDSVVHMIEYIQREERHTFVVSVLDGRNMLSALYINGKYTYTSRVRLLSDRDSKEMVKEVQKYMSAISQFNKSQKTGMELEHIYFCGLRDDEKADVLRTVSETLEVAVDELSENKLFKISKESDYKLSDYIYTTGNLFRR